MKVFCPQCQESVSFVSHQTEKACPSCGFLVNVTQMDTMERITGPPLETDYSGQRLGPYQLKSVLGHGGMGTVYLARHEETQERVAIKVLNELFARNATFVKRFQRESEILRRLDHPHIVRFREAGVSDERFYYAMDYIDGLPLNRHIRNHRVSLPQKFAMASQVCRALSYAHSQGVIHRDIKPSNILVTPTHEVRLVDFGIAHHALIEGDATQLTTTNAVLGTYNYMSPEQRLSAARVDERSDIYAFGVVLYELFVGRLPMGAFSRPTETHRELSRRFDRLITRCLAPNPADRFPTMTATLAELRAVSSTPSATTRRSVLAAALVIALLGGGTATAVWGPRIWNDSGQPLSDLALPELAETPDQQRGKSFTAKLPNKALRTSKLGGVQSILNNNDPLGKTPNSQSLNQLKTLPVDSTSPAPGNTDKRIPGKQLVKRSSRRRPSQKRLRAQKKTRIQSNRKLKRKRRKSPRKRVRTNNSSVRISKKGSTKPLTTPTTSQKKSAPKKPGTPTKTPPEMKPTK